LFQVLTVTDLVTAPGVVETASKLSNWASEYALENADGLNADGENALGEKALGLNAEGEKAEGENALGLKADGLNADGLKAEGENADGLAALPGASAPKAARFSVEFVRALKACLISEKTATL
jgi:hypothetical protein